jgi:hypothetical protein
MPEAVAARICPRSDLTELSFKIIWRWHIFNGLPVTRICQTVRGVSVQLKEILHPDI